jgi:ATP-binding cassette subfamily F protein 3
MPPTLSTAQNKSMLVLDRISLSFGGRDLLDQVQWQVRPQDRVALIGANGSGKSTLMKIICGLQESDSGNITSPKSTTFGYLPQQGISFEGRTLFEEVRSVFADLLDIEVRLREMENRMGDELPDAEREELLETYDSLQEFFRQHDGYRLEAEVGHVLEGLGFGKEDWTRQCEHFSGGWQMRIALAKLLLERPSILLLDEPTNHLDIEARNWLEDYLKDYEASIVLVSHDRFFLDAVVKRCTELFQGKLTDYAGNYSYYEVERERRIEALRESARRQQEEITKIEQFIERFRYKASKATQVQSRVKQLEKIERIVVPPPPPKSFSFRFPEALRSGRIVLQVEGIHKAYGDNEVLKNIDFQVERNERVALVGVNGAGKSTLMRILAGEDSFQQGERTEGHQMQLAYFAQDQSQVLNPRHTVLQSLEEVTPYDKMPEVRSMLGAFLFQGDDVHKKTSVLSGGERNRLALSRMLMRPANILLLDEPTNHLDLQAKDVLLNALLQFPGTLVFVSHDRYFINNLATRVVEVGNQQLESFPGTYEEYFETKMRRGDANLGADNVRWATSAEGGNTGEADVARRLKRQRSAPDEKSEEKQQKYFEAQQLKRERTKKLRKWRKELETVESNLESWEAEVKEMEALMADPAFYENFEASQATLEKYNQRKAEIQQAYEQWEELSLQIAELEEEENA